MSLAVVLAAPTPSRTPPEQQKALTRYPRSIVQGRNTLFAMFGGKVPLRAAQVRPGEKLYLMARVGLNRNGLIEAAESCLKVGSGGTI